ncbi:HNH endonuclease [uncultured Sphingomonas sp.]|nr:HNH endonuclease signature motif containing protein [Sphingomonas bacterium]
MAERLRGRAGQAQRARRLRAEPLCRRCSERGMVSASTVPDHIKPLALGGSDDDSNIRCLCKSCHDEVTAEQFGQRQARPIGCDASGLPTDPRHPWHGSIDRGGPSKLSALMPGHRIDPQFHR